MQRQILIRFLQSLIALLVLSIVIFVMVRASGDPVNIMLPPEASATDRVYLTAALGLDQPYPVQYFMFLKGAVKGDFGKSFRYRQPVGDIVFDRLPSSAQLAGVAVLIALLIAFPLGILAAVRRGTWVDTLTNVVAVLGQSVIRFPGADAN